MKRSISICLLLAALTGCPNNSPSSAPAHSEGDGHDHKGEAKGHAEGDGHDHTTETKKGN